MRTINSREGFEGDSINIEKLSKAPSTSRQWPGFRNPRIVRVSRTFGGKDRHSKVCTIRGLRDRRIRLSVTTAIQLYDLQDKLGVSQPSKVIDWLLEATKNDIDLLPPLQFPQSFPQFHHQTLQLPYHESSASQSSLGTFYGANSTFGESQNLLAKSRFWDIDAVSRLKDRENNERGSIFEKGKWIKTNEHESEDGIGGYGSQISVQNLFPTGSHSPLPVMLNNAMPMTYNSYHSDPSNLSLSHFGSSHGLFPSQAADPHQSGGNGVQFPSSLHVPSGSQLFFCPPSATSSLFAPCAPYITSSAESDTRPFNQIQFLSSSSQALTRSLIPSFHSNDSPLKPFPTPFSSKLLGLDNDYHRDQPNKDI
ncbi:hypothetical protein L6164_014491 [Bauhinia variegata]|uniref:Uncharacterized protein n=1 Tax=Bauhinia variegata TaxID=167791 RepID=A0ACB9NHR5_BAUVA|nr:hypothetical protein L6164_014491 [Bauhinia variegata]